MAPANGESIAVSRRRKMSNSKPPRLSVDSLHRTTSDISFELSKETRNNLAPISEIQNVKCECCGMSEECTPEHIERVRDKFSGKWICGLCGEAVKEEVERNGGKKEEALSAHTSACVRFNKIGRVYPVLYQAEAMRELLRKSGDRAKSISPRDKNNGAKKGGISRSSSCIPAITREINDLTITK